MMIIVDCKQSNPGWKEVRKSMPTASYFDNIVTSQGLRSKQRTKYLYQLVGERVSGIREESYQNPAMKRGIELESEARMLYEILTGETVLQVGFCLHDNRKFGCSPDGLIAEEGGIEIKCPSSHVHVEYLLSGVLPTEYIQQVQGSLLITGRKWWDFMSYYPGIRPLIIRVYRNEEFIKSLESELNIFCSELDATTERIK